LLLLYWLIRNKTEPLFIHARTDYSAAVAATIKSVKKFRLVWDARGDTLSEFEDDIPTMRLPYRWLAPLKQRAIRKRLAIAARACDRAIFVSDALRKLQGADVEPVRTMVVPCLAEKDFFFFSPTLRSEMRRRLGYREDELVLIYSGSVEPWQCVGETVALMQKALQADRRCRALVVTPVPDAFEPFISPGWRSRFTLASGTLKDINGFLNAADIGIMLRQKNRINWVASPVKYAEYSLAGLRVVTADAVEQATYFGVSIGHLIDPAAFPHILRSIRHADAERDERAARAASLLSRSVHSGRISELYR
jgi:hypothetical protein